MTLLALNLGCGFGKFQDTEQVKWINVDNSKETQPHIIRNILQGLPFDDDKFDLVYCSHFLEHFGGQDFIFVLNEIHRVLKTQGVLRVLSPFHKFWGAWTDPNHKVFFNEHSFEPWWFPNTSSWSMGIQGFFYPVVLEIAEEKEFRCIMKKIPSGALKSYTEQIGIKQGEHYLEPDWQNLLKNTKFYGEKTEVLNDEEKS